MFVYIDANKRAIIATKVFITSTFFSEIIAKIETKTIEPRTAKKLYSARI